MSLFLYLLQFFKTGFKLVIMRFRHEGLREQQALIGVFFSPLGPE